MSLCETKFADLNDWFVTDMPFTFRSLAGEEKDRGLEPRGYDVQLLLFRSKKTRRPAAIATQPSGECESESVCAAVSAYKLIQHTPRATFASFYSPGNRRLFIYTRSDVVVKWLPEQWRGFYRIQSSDFPSFRFFIETTPITDDPPGDLIEEMRSHAKWINSPSQFRTNVMEESYHGDKKSDLRRNAVERVIERFHRWESAWLSKRVKFFEELYAAAADETSSDLLRVTY